MGRSRVTDILRHSDSGVQTVRLIDATGLLCRCLSAAACPNITLEALDGNRCSNNSEIVVTTPGPVALRCLYEDPPRTTNYTWSLGTTVLPEFSTSSVLVDIPPGRHQVKCAASIDESSDCPCRDEQALSIVVIGT